MHKKTVKRIFINDSMPDAHLAYLYLDSTLISDQGLLYLKSLKSLRVLGIHETAITDTGLQYLNSMSHLEELYPGPAHI
jgi:hypothetical protein